MVASLLATQLGQTSITLTPALELQAQIQMSRPTVVSSQNSEIIDEP